MKLLNKFLISIAAVSLVACSSMDVEESEAIAENFPDDFSGAEYMELHPELVSLQIRNYIAGYNDEVKASLSAEAIAEDAQAFVDDTVQLRKIYANPYYGGFGDDRWVEAFKPIDTIAVTCKTANVFTQLNMKQVSGEDTTDIKVIAPITVVKDADDTNKIVKVTGMTDSAATEPETFELNDTLFLLKGNKMGSSKTDTVSCDTTHGEKPGALKTLDVNYLKNFNIVDTKNDLAKIESIPLDTFAISLQYVVFGEANGWAYRKCKDSEKDNPVITEEYPVSKRYCADAAGNAREIK